MFVKKKLSLYSFRYRDFRCKDIFYTHWKGYQSFV